jgi:membrane-associated protease RseP (regulator of RpoE activity)
LVDARQGEGIVVFERGMIGIALSRAGGEGSVVVAHPTPDSPAAAAGIQDGDVVLAIDGVKVGTTDEIVRHVSAHAAGQKVKVTIRRDGTEKVFEVPLVPVPAAPAANPNAAVGTSSSSGAGGSSTSSSLGGAPISVPGPAHVPPRVTAVRPDSIYIVDPEGQLRAIPVDPNDKYVEQLRSHYDSLYRNRQDATLAVPAIQIQRSDMEKKIEAIGRDVLTMRQQMEKLTEELQRLQKQLSAAPSKP